MRFRYTALKGIIVEDKVIFLHKGISILHFCRTVGGNFDSKGALRCAEVRARYRIRTPDALQIATALEKGAGVFLTNDADLPPKADGLQVIVLRDFLESPTEN